MSFDAEHPKDPAAEAQPPAYQPPDIAWEEPWEPVALALSCNRNQGNPGCNPGPFGG